MPRYIDAEKLEKDGWWASRTYRKDATSSVYETKQMTDFPAADVRENVHAHDTGEDWIFHCSNCGYGIDDVFESSTTAVDIYEDGKEWRFCPNCGARMEKGEEDENC